MLFEPTLPLLFSVSFTLIAAEPSAAEALPPSDDTVLETLLSELSVLSENSVLFDSTLPLLFSEFSIPTARLSSAAEALLLSDDASFVVAFDVVSV